MPLLAGKNYDPATAVTASTATLIAMTAFDTTNLRLTFNAPSSGTVLVRMRGVIHGAATFPQVTFGVLSGTTVMGRQVPLVAVGGTAAATTFAVAEAAFLVTGLTGGAAQTWDAAYSVETIVAATGIKYGGPNNTTANDAFGGFTFEVWQVN